VSIHKRTAASGRPSWQVKWREAGRDSRQRSESFPTRREAQAFEAEIRRIQRMGAHAPGEPSHELLEEWLAAWFATNRATWSPSTRKIYASNLDRWIVPYIGGVRLRELGTERLYAWRDDIVSDGASPTIVTNVMKTLSSALGEAVDYGKLPANPLLGVKRLPIMREPRQALSAEKAERIRAELPTDRDRVLWGLLYAAGLRTQEAIALRWSDLIDLSRSGGVIKVDRVLVEGEIFNRTKTGRGRDVEIIAPLAQDLVAFRASVLNWTPGDLICQSTSGTPINLHNWRTRELKPAARAAGVEWATPYSGHHTYISLQIHAGVSVVTIAAMCGNSPEIIWHHYAREFDRSRTAKPVPLEGAIRAARRWVARSRVPAVFPESNVVELKPRR